MQDPLKQGLKRENCSTCPGSVDNSNARSIKTRIETVDRCKNVLGQGNIRMQDPLKQGLKLTIPVLWFAVMGNSNARSIKTRIETSISRSFSMFRVGFECKIH
mgnify:CR=1 FL=1